MQRQAIRLACKRCTRAPAGGGHLLFLHIPMHLTMVACLLLSSCCHGQCSIKPLACVCHAQTCLNQLGALQKMHKQPPSGRHRQGEKHSVKPLPCLSHCHAQSCLNQLLGALGAQKMRVTPSGRQCLLGSMYELLELKVRQPCSQHMHCVLFFAA